jgi:hypothetical protein
VLTVERNDATCGTTSSERRRKKAFDMVIMIFVVGEICSSSGEITSIELTPYAQEFYYCYVTNSPTTDFIHLHAQLPKNDEGVSLTRELSLHFDESFLWRCLAM